MISKLFHLPIFSGVRLINLSFDTIYIDIGAYLHSLIHLIIYMYYNNYV